MSKKEYKNITVIIRTIDCVTEKVESEVVRNIDSHERRSWLAETLQKTAMWAMLNHKYMEVVNKEDDTE